MEIVKTVLENGSERILIRNENTVRNCAIQDLIYDLEYELSDTDFDDEDSVDDSYCYTLDTIEIRLADSMAEWDFKKEHADKIIYLMDNAKNLERAYELAIEYLETLLVNVPVDYRDSIFDWEEEEEFLKDE